MKCKVRQRKKKAEGKNLRLDTERKKWIPRRVLSSVLVPLIYLLTLRSFCVFADAADNEERAAHAIQNGLYAFADRIDLTPYAITPEALSRILAFVVKDDPYLFFVDDRFAYSYRPDGFVLSLTPVYTMTREETVVARNFCLDLIRSATERAGGSELSCALYLHDYVCRSFSYDESLRNDDIYTMLLTGYGTCQAYTQLYIALLREEGIESHFVASDTIAHVWNLVKLEGEWYHVDLTWDDSASRDGEICYRHFLCSDRIAEARGHRDWYTPVETACDSECYLEFDFIGLSHRARSAGDVNHDDAVDLRDLLLLRCLLEGEGSAFSSVPCPHCADLDGDGTRNEADLALLRGKLLEGN